MSEEQKTKALVNVQDGDMVAENPEGILKIAQMHLRSGMLPKQYNSIEKVVTACALAKQLNLPPLVALRQIAVINGSPSLYGDLPLSLVTRSKDFEYIREYFIDEDCNEICIKNKNIRAEVFGAVCVTKRKGTPHEHETWFTKDDQTRANLRGPVWNSYPRLMMKYRARSANLKDNFPECLNGAAIAEYDNSALPEIEGQVLNGLNPSGERTRMEQIKEKFLNKEVIEVEPEAGPVSEVEEPEVSKPRRRKRSPKKKKREVEVPPAQVAESELVGGNGEMFDMRPTNQP
jgi:hypothetical protein